MATAYQDFSASVPGVTVATFSTVRALVIGDPHFQVSNLAEVETFCSNLLKLIEHIKPDIVVILGDFLHRHETIHVDPLCKAVKLLEEISKTVHVYLLIGNHDRRNNSDFMSEFHPFTAIKKWKDVTVIDKATKVNVTPKKRCGENAMGANFLFVPYVPDGRFAEALDTIDLKEFEDGWKSKYIDAIFAHQTFYGAKMGAIESKDGDRWDPEWPLVISGHIHDHDHLQPNILYTGAPMQHAFGDKANKTVGLFEFNPCVDLEKSPNAKKLVEKHPVILDKPEPEIRTKYFRIDLGLRTKRIMTVNYSSLKDVKISENERVKILVKGTKEELKILGKSSYAKALKEKGAVVVPVLELPEKKETKDHKETKDPRSPRSVLRSKSYLEIYRDFVKENEDALKYFDVFFKFSQASEKGPTPGKPDSGPSGPPASVPPAKKRIVIGAKKST